MQNKRSPDDAQGADQVVASIGQLREVLLGRIP